MASRAVPPLTRIGFRRDIKLFLTLLVGFLAALIVLLIFFLQSTLARTRDAMWERENDLASVAAAELPEVLARGGDLDAQLLSIRTRYGFDAVELRVPGRRPVSSGITQGLEAIDRRAGGAHALFYFDPAPYQELRRRFFLTAGLSIFATAVGIALLFLYLPKILGPIEEMLDHARELGERREGTDEAAYLIETFRRSIETLKKQEAELKILHEREKRRADDLETITSTLTRSLTSGFIALGPDERLVEMNAAAREIVGAATIEGDSEFARVLTEAAANRRPVSRREVDLDGKTIGLTTVPLFDAEEKFLGTLALFTDLTQVRRLESRVRELQTLADLGVMSAGIAHEFRNSLSTILGLLKLAEKTQPPPEIATKLKAAETEANQLADAVTSLLHFARPMQLQLTDVSLLEIARSVVARLREIASGVTFSIDGEDAIVRGDAVLLSRAVENLVRNAIDAVADREAPSVRIDIRAEGPRMTISDNGPGITDADAANLFLPFYTTKASGVGIGLPLARKIFLLHDADIRIESAAGEGTTVAVTFSSG